MAKLAYPQRVTIQSCHQGRGGSSVGGGGSDDDAELAEEEDKGNVSSMHSTYHTSFCKVQTLEWS